MSTDTTTPTVEWATLTDEQICSAYAVAKERKDKAEAAVKKAEAVMVEIKNDMLRRMQEAGNTGFKNPVAAVVRTIRNTASCGDWMMFYQWMYNRAKQLEAAGQPPEQAFAFLQKRLTIGEVEAYLADPENGGSPPPAINVLPEYSVRVTVAK